MRKRGDIARASVELGAIGHLDVQCALDVVLEMRRLAQLGIGQPLDVGGPSPARLQAEPADLAASDAEQIDPAEVEAADLVRGVEALALADTLTAAAGRLTAGETVSGPAASRNQAAAQRSSTAAQVST